MFHLISCTNSTTQPLFWHAHCNIENMGASWDPLHNWYCPYKPHRLCTKPFPLKIIHAIEPDTWLMVAMASKTYDQRIPEWIGILSDPSWTFTLIKSDWSLTISYDKNLIMDDAHKTLSSARLVYDCLMLFNAPNVDYPLQTGTMAFQITERSTACSKSCSE